MHLVLVLPHFTYCSNGWSDGSCSHTEKLKKLQKRAARVITGSTYEIRSTETFEKLGWERIEIILKKREHIMTFKALRGDTPKYLSDLFVPSHNDMYQLRSNDRKLHAEKTNTNFLKKSFSYRGAVSWNSLPGEIVDLHDQPSLPSYKTLINHYYKDLEKNTSTI